MTKKKKDYKLTPFWKEIAEIVKMPSYKGEKIKLNGDYVLYKKIVTFLYRGSAGTLYEIKQALGEEKLKSFFDYLIFYLSDAETPGHYYPSKLVNKQIREIKQTRGLFDLNDTLNQISKVEFEKHGDKEAKGWLPNESPRKKKLVK